MTNIHDITKANRLKRIKVIEILKSLIWDKRNPNKVPSKEAWKYIKKPKKNSARDNINVVQKLKQNKQNKHPVAAIVVATATAAANIEDIYVDGIFIPKSKIFINNNNDNDNNNNNKKRKGRKCIEGYEHLGIFDNNVVKKLVPILTEDQRRLLRSNPQISLKTVGANYRWVKYNPPSQQCEKCNTLNTIDSDECGVCGGKLTEIVHHENRSANIDINENDDDVDIIYK